MSFGFPTDFKELVRSRTSLVELVSESISLTPLRGGTDFLGLCPFHDDHNPSFHIYPDRQSYRCWVCQEGGDCFSFLMKKDNISFPQALEYLAERANLELPKESRPSPQQQKKKSLFEVLAWAEDEYHRCFLHAPEAGAARSYMSDRGYDLETLKDFKVGYHPEDWHWLINRAKGKFTPEQLMQVKLVGQSDKSQSYYDYFLDRVLFPIHDERSRPVAFGGRILPATAKQDAPKYWNSPESDFFSKSHLLYAFPEARDTIRKSGTVVVMEGYTDCLTAFQFGITNCVATLGTALTEHHVRNLKRFARKVVLLYDADQAGQDAAERSLTKFLAQEVDLRILTLPGQLDPAEYLTAHGADSLKQLIEEAPEAWERKLTLTLNRYGLDSIDARQRVMDEMLQVFLQSPRLSGSTRESMILSHLARRVGEDEAVVRTRLSELRSRAQKSFTYNTASATSPSTETAGENLQNNLQHEIEGALHRGLENRETTRHWNGRDGKLTRHDRLECELLEMIFAVPTLIHPIRQEVGVDDFLNPFLKELLQVCFDLLEEEQLPAYDSVTCAVESPELKNLSARVDELSREQNIQTLLAKDGDPASSEIFQEALKSVKWRREELRHLQTKGQFVQHQPSTVQDRQAENQIDADALELLKQAAQFHQKRATKKTT